MMTIKDDKGGNGGNGGKGKKKVSEFAELMNAEIERAKEHTRMVLAGHEQDRQHNLMVLAGQEHDRQMSALQYHVTNLQAQYDSLERLMGLPGITPDRMNQLFDKLEAKGVEIGVKILFNKSWGRIYGISNELTK